MTFKTCLAVSLSLVSFAVGQAQALDRAKLDAFFDRLAEKDKAMGSVTLAKDGDVVYTRAIGYAQLDGAAKKPLTAASRFRIGSITKTFTAVMILQLVEERKLKLTDTLDAFAPEVPNAPKITIEQLLGHRSGVPNVRREQDPQHPLPNLHTTPMAKEEMMGLIVKATPSFEPGTRFLYSNSGYFLLGLVVEKATGKSYADALAERVTAKIGLEDTYVATGEIDVSKNESLTYISFGRDWKQVPETHPSILFGAGAIVSTTGDLARFIHALFEGKLVAPESLTRMKTMREGYGLGLEPYTFAGKTFYGHAGGGDNYGSWLAYLPEEKLAVAYATNAKVYPVATIVSNVVDLYYRKPFEIPTFESVAISAEVLERYVGVYATADAPVKMTITREGTTLMFQPPGPSGAVPLEATTETTFKIDAARMEVEFDAAKNQMTIKRRGGERVFTKEK